MAKTYEQWSSWSSWQVHSVKRGVSTTYRSGRVLWLKSRDPKAASKVLRSEQRFKTEATPRAGEPGGIPSQPKPVTPISPDTSTPSGSVGIAPLGPTPESEKAASDAELKKLEGKYVDVKFRTPMGDVKRFTTKRLPHLARTPGGIPGEVMSIAHAHPSGKQLKPFYDVSKQVLTTEAPMIKLKREWSESDFTKIPDRYRRQFHEVIPGVGVVQGAKIPSIIKDLGIHEEYVRYHYAASLDMLGGDFSESVDKLIKHSMTQEYAKEHYRWDGKTFAELKKEDPALYMTGTGTSITVSKDVERWEKEETARAWRDRDLGHIARGAATWVFNPKRLDFVLSSLTGGQIVDKEGYVVGYKSPESYLSEGYYEQEMKIRKGDVGGWITGTVLSPVSLGIITMGVGTGTSAIASTALGGRALFTVGGKVIPVVTVTPSTYVKVGVGAAFAGSTVAGMEQAYKTGGWEAVERQVKKAILISPYLIASYQVGMGYGSQLAYKTGQMVSGAKTGLRFVVGEAYRVYMPSKVKGVFASAKRTVLTYDPFFKTRIYQTVIPHSIGQARVDISRWYSEFKTHRAATIHAKDISYYGHELYPYAVKHKLVKDVGLSKLSELRTPYTHYKTGGWWRRPEDISFMPHKIPETSTYTFYTPKGMKFLSVAKDRSSFSYGDIKPLDTGIMGKQIGIGKKGGKIIDMSATSKEIRMLIEGKTIYKYYTKTEGPLGTIPSIGKKPLHGIITSREISLKFGQISSDIVVMKSTGSFKIGAKPGTDPYAGFAGRLFDETYYTKGVAFSKRVGGTQQITEEYAPGKFGLKTVEMPEFDYAISKMRIDGIGSSVDRAISFFDIGKPKARISFGGGLGSETISKPDFVLPGGLGTKTAKISYPQLIKPMQPLFQRVSLGQLEAMESGIGYTSSYWSGVMLSVASLSIPLTTKATDVSRISKPLSISIQASINIQQQSSLNIQRTLNTSLSAQSQIQNQIVQQTTQQLQQQQQQQSQVQQQQLQMLTVSIVQPPSARYSYRYGHGGTPPTTPPRIPRIPWLLGLDDVGKGKYVESDIGQGFNVMVKDRHIFHGKGTGKQRFIQVNKNPVSQLDALALGGQSVDNSAAATFYIKPTRKPAQELGIIIPSWDIISYKFRTKTGKPMKPGSKLIEHTAHRIDSPGEIKGISALGWIAKQPKKKVSIKHYQPKPSKVKRDPMSFIPRMPKPKKYVDDEYEDPMDVFEKVNKQINKAMKIRRI